MIQVGNTVHGEAIAAWASCLYNPRYDIVLSHSNPKKLLGGVIFTDYTGEGGSIKAHVAGVHPNWLTRDFLWVLFDYPFNQLKANKIIGVVRSSNLKALEFDKRLCFTEEARIRDVFPDGDAIVLGMYRDNCPWLKIKPKRLKPHG
jgi:RimJ/RimL family protein N-acetyltransferase